METYDVTKKYDVFISFRGEDTRSGFTSHLHAALCRNGMETYIDYRIQKGEEVWGELLNAIRESSMLLVIFSENYASSSWCMNELVQLMECKKREEDVHVIPVFYKIDPSQIRKQSRKYKVETANQKWNDALFHAANLSGFHFNHQYRTESDLIEDIVKALLQKLNHNHTNDFRGHFIYDENYSNIEYLLKLESKEARVIGIWGMGGIGKTTLAAAIFQKFSPQYEGTGFLENVAEESKKHGLNYIFNKLLSKLLKEDLHIDTAKLIPSNVKRRLKHKKVLVVLDDVNTPHLLQNLAGTGRDWLGAGSRVIVTSRDRHVFISGGLKEEEIYKVKEMNYENSLELFSLNAFGKIDPEKGFEELSKRATTYTKGNPLALKVLGSFLCSKDEIEWCSALNKLKRIPNAEIQAVLRLSYDGLDADEQNIFLEIACFFKGQDREHVTQILNACDFSANIGIRSLLDKALIVITPYNCIDMHDLTQDMAREIVREESTKNPGQRTRLWDPMEVYEVLTNDRGTYVVEAISFDMTHMSQIPYLHLRANVFEKTPNLRLLVFQSLKSGFKRINSVYLPEGLKFLPQNLRYFEWNGYPLRSLPSNFCPEKLVVISMKYSNVQRLWPGLVDLPNLEKIYLDCSKYLVRSPNLSHAPNLKVVSMSGCKRLAYVHPSVFSLPKLRFLNVYNCQSLKSLSNNTWSQSLKYLGISKSGLNELSPSIFPIRNLTSFCSSINNGLADLPEHFAKHILLCDPIEQECDTLSILHKVLPSSGFRSVTGLSFFCCNSLCKLPDISLLSSLHELYIYKCTITSLPESIKYLERLKQLMLSKCKMLQHIPALPESILCLHVWRCESLETVLSSSIEPSKRPKFTFMLPNCIKLDERSYDAILKDSLLRIEFGAKALSAAVLENEDEAFGNYIFPLPVRNGKICYFFPARSDKVREWFHCHFTQSLVNIELPPNLLGFIFYSVVFQVQSRNIEPYRNIGCDCYLETSTDERINITSLFVDAYVSIDPRDQFQFTGDHVFLWYDAHFCKQIMEVIKGRVINDKSTTHYPKLAFKFFFQTPYNDDSMIIKECGFRWVYSLEEGECNSKRSIDILEVEETLPPK